MGGVPSCNCNCKNKNQENEIILPEKTKKEPKSDTETLSSRIEKEETNISTKDSLNSRNITNNKEKYEPNLMNPSFLEHSQRVVLRGDNGIIDEENEDNLSESSQHIKMEIYEDRLSISDYENKSEKQEEQQVAKINTRTNIPKNEIANNDDKPEEQNFTNNCEQNNNIHNNCNNNIIPTSSQNTERKFFSSILEDKPDNHCNPKDETIIICDDDNFCNKEDDININTNNNDDNNAINQNEFNCKVEFTDISEIKTLSPLREYASKVETKQNIDNDNENENDIINENNNKNEYINNDNENNNKDDNDNYIPPTSGNPNNYNTNPNYNNKIFEISNSSFLIENTSLQTKQFNSQSTRKVQDNLFTLSPSRSSQVNKTFVFPHQQPIILSEESFNIQLIKDNKTVESCLNQTEFIGMSKKKPKSHRKRILKLNNAKQIRKYADRNIIFFSDIQKINEADKKNIIQINRFCTLNTSNELCLYKTKEQFLLSQKPIDIVRLDSISKVDLISTKTLGIMLKESSEEIKLTTESGEITQKWYNILIKYIK